MVLALFALLAVADTTLPDGVLGSWVTADVAISVEDGEREGTSGTVLYRHLDITDSAFVTTAIVEDTDGELEGAWVPVPYRAVGARAIFGDGAFEADLEVSHGTLVVTVSDSLGVVANVVTYSRSEALGVPPEVVGLWERDRASEGHHPFSAGLRFRRDGVAESALGGEPVRFVVAGPYVLFETVVFEGDQDPRLIARGAAFRYEVIGDRLTLKGSDDEEDVVVLARRSPVPSTE